MSKREMSDYGTIWDKKDEKTDFIQDASDEIRIRQRLGWYCAILMILVVVAGTFFTMMFTATGLFVGCGPGEFIIVQSVKGNMSVIDKTGVHFKGLSTYWVYPRRLDFEFKTVRGTFNDGKLRGIDTMACVFLPLMYQNRLDLHVKFAADYNNIEKITESMIVNAVKNTAPIMSTKELQGSRKREFYDTVYNQMMDGLYRMTTKVTDDGSYATEIDRDADGNPLILMKPLFEQYGLTLVHFSITRIVIPDDELKALMYENIAKNYILKAELETEYEKAEKLRILAKTEKEAAYIEGEKMREVFRKQLLRERKNAQLLKELRAEGEREIEADLDRAEKALKD